MKSLFDDVKPEDVKYDDPDLQKRHTSYKYQGLLEERLLLRKLNEYIGIGNDTPSYNSTEYINRSFTNLVNDETNELNQLLYYL